MIWLKLNKSSHLLALLILLLLIGCNKHKEVLIGKVQEVILSKPAAFGDLVRTKEVLVIIPRTGCSGCIGLADSYFKEETYDSSRVQFVFTKITSLKTLKIRIGKEKTEQSHVYVDTENSFSAGKLGSMYPMIAFIEKGKIVELEFLSPDKKHLINRLRGLL